MLSARQRKEIKKKMYHIKDAKNDPHLGEKAIKERTKELYRYLEQEGIILPDDE